MILPIVKKQIKKDGFCNIPPVITCSFDGDIAKLGAEALASFDERTELAEGNAFITFALLALLFAIFKFLRILHMCFLTHDVYLIPDLDIPSTR